MWKRLWKNFLSGTCGNRFLNYLNILAIGGGLVTILILFGNLLLNVFFHEQWTKKNILDKFLKDETYLRYLPVNSVETLKPEQRMNFMPNNSTITVVVGESGIGKATEICQYANELRKAGSSGSLL